MDSDEFWSERLSAVKSKLISDVIVYCDLYDILHGEVFNADNVKTELTELVNRAVTIFMVDNH